MSASQSAFLADSYVEPQRLRESARSVINEASRSSARELRPMTLPALPSRHVAMPRQGDQAVIGFCDAKSFKPMSHKGTMAVQPRRSQGVACKCVFPELISVCSFGLIILGAHRRFDRLLDAMAILADVHDVASLD
jgi:hypothetical protein